MLRFNTVVGRILAGYVVFLILLVAGLVTTFILTNQQKDDGLIVNLAGRQRMLTQKMTKETLIYAAKSQASEKDREKWARQILSTMQVFESTLYALKDGGPAPTNLEMTSFRQSPSANTREISDQLEKVKTLWLPFKDYITQVIDSGGQNQAALDFIIENNPLILKEMDAAVVLMQIDSEQKVRQFIMVQGGMVGLGTLLIIVGIFIINANIVRPILDLIKAADEISRGNLKVEISEKGTREIADLAVSFNRMRVSLQKMMDRMLKANT